MEPDAQGFISQLANPTAPYDTKIIDTIPKAFGLDSVRDWGTLCIDDYVSKLTQAKKEVEAAATVIPVPEIKGKEGSRKISESKWEVDDCGSIEIVLKDGINLVVYTVDGTDPRSSLTGIKTSENIILREVFADKSGVQIKARGVDESGNYSDLLTCYVVNKEKEFKVDVSSDDLFSKKGTFKIPDSLAALKAVLGSTVDLAVQDGVITSDQARKLKQSFKEL
jgi:hypothetical protein